MEELNSARMPFRIAYDTLYRRERIFKYVYWLENGAKPAFTLIGSWITPDMRTELAMWQSMSKKGFDDIDVVDTVTEDLERRFGLDHAAARVRATDPELARRHLPIWNNAADCLIPQKLGDFHINGMQTYAQLSMGQSYAYRHTIADAKLTLYLCDHGCALIEPGITDPRLQDLLRDTIKIVKDLAKSQGGTVQQLTEPQVVFIRPPVGIEIPFASTTWELVSADGSRVTEGLSMTGFRDMFLKLRVSGSTVFFDADVGQAAVAALNLDLADFVAEFGLPKPRD